MLVVLLTSPHAYQKAFHAVHCIIPAHRVASQKKNIFATHPHIHDELIFTTLDRIYEKVMRDGEEKMHSILIMDDVTASLKNLDFQMLLKKTDLQPYALPLVYHMPSAELQCLCPSQSGRR